MYIDLWAWLLFSVDRSLKKIETFNESENMLINRNCCDDQIFNQKL